MPDPMAATDSDFSPSQLAEFLRVHRGDILQRWQTAVEDRPASQGLSPTALIDHMPDLLDAIAETGEAHLVDKRSRLDTETAERHALERLGEGLDLSHVVIELAVLRDCILQVWIGSVLRARPARKCASSTAPWTGRSPPRSTATLLLGIGR